MKKNFFLCVLLFVLALPSSAFAFCGFYVGGAGKKLFNDATSVILMRSGHTTTLSMENDYAGPAKDFAMVIPVPEVLQKSDVKTLHSSLFEKVDQLASPRLVEYWEEDPCYRPPQKSLSGKGSRVASKGVGKSVKVKARFKVAEYDIVVLSAENSTGLETWLKDNKYNIPKKAAQYFQPYIQSGMYFFVAKVDITKVKKRPGGGYRLSPLRFSYQSDDFSLPIRLGLINSRGSQDLIVHILSENQRYEVGNYPSVMIPTNIELKPSAKKNFGSFYTSLFNAVLKANPGSVVTEYSWQAKNCDPCPRTPLTTKDLLSLGGDIVKKRNPKARLKDFVLTRLHTRYQAGNIGEDLVFKKAPAIEGGRERWGRGKKLAHRVRKSSFNQFQARYIIRHRWKKKTRCKNPRRGRWSGNSSAKTSSKKTAYTTLKKRAYRSFSKSRINLKNVLSEELTNPDKDSPK